MENTPAVGAVVDMYCFNAVASKSSNLTQSGGFPLKDFAKDRYFKCIPEGGWMNHQPVTCGYWLHNFI